VDQKAVVASAINQPSWHGGKGLPFFIVIIRPQSPQRYMPLAGAFRPALYLESLNTFIPLGLLGFIFSPGLSTRNVGIA